MHFRLLLLVAAIGASPACLMRQLNDVTDHRTENVTLIETHDMIFPFALMTGKQVFWECTEGEGKLVCARTCDVKDANGVLVKCPRLTGI